MRTRLVRHRPERLAGCLLLLLSWSHRHVLLLWLIGQLQLFVVDLFKVLWIWFEFELLRLLLLSLLLL
jgi:hypothetical protein